MFAQHGGARGTYYGLGTLDPRQSRTSWPQSFPSPCSQKFFKGCGWVDSFCESAHPLSPNGRMCSEFPAASLPTNPLSQHRNTMCAHGCVVVDGDSVFVCATRGRARDLLWCGHSGPKTIADLMAAVVPRRCAVCTNPSPVDPTLFCFSRLSLVCLLHLMVPSVS